MEQLQMRHIVNRVGLGMSKGRLGRLDITSHRCTGESHILLDLRRIEDESSGALELVVRESDALEHSAVGESTTRLHHRLLVVGDTSNHAPLKVMVVHEPLNWTNNVFPVVVPDFFEQLSTSVTRSHAPFIQETINKM